MAADILNEQRIALDDLTPYFGRWSRCATATSSLTVTTRTRFVNRSFRATTSSACRVMTPTH